MTIGETPDVIPSYLELTGQSATIKDRDKDSSALTPTSS